MKNISIIVFLISNLIRSLNYNYKILFEKALNKNLQIPTEFIIPDLITNWNLSFWFRINYINTLITDKPEVIEINNNSNIPYYLKINPNASVEFNSVFFTNCFIHDTNIDLKNLSSISTKWIFFSLNYKLNNFQVFNSSNNLNFVTTTEYLAADSAKIFFRNTNFLNSDILLAHVHFFETFIPISDLQEIIYYPQNILALYKFSNLHSNNNLIVNSINFKKYRSVRITNNNKVPFGNFNTYVDVKIDLPLFNTSIVSKNLIISLKGTISIKNFVQSDSYLNKIWVIDWYKRTTEVDLNILNFKSELRYTTISASNHYITIENKLIQENQGVISGLSTNVGLSFLNPLIRNEENINITSFVQIKDIPLPNNQPRNRKFRGKIPYFKYDKEINFNFDLSFFDSHFFKITFDNSIYILFHFVLNEIMVYTGDFIDDDISQSTYLGRNKKILVTCSDNDDLLRNYPDKNENIILDKCISNEFKCPSILGCDFCVLGICMYCKTDYELVNNTCLKCQYNRISYNNVCTWLASSTITEFNDTYNSGISNKVIAVKFKFETLVNYQDNTSPTNSYKSSLFYPIISGSEESPLHLINLLNFPSYSLYTIRHRSFTPVASSQRNFDISYGCLAEENFQYNINQNFEGDCLSDCTNTYVINNYCVEPYYWCLEGNIDNNRCKTCNKNYIDFYFDVESAYCLPDRIETSLIQSYNSENNIIFLDNITCNDSMCLLCSLDGITCYVCYSAFTLILGGICEILNCSNFINNICTACQTNYTLFNERCIPNSSFINNCIEFDNSINQYCNLCDINFFLYDNLAPYDCIDNSNKDDFCDTYSANPDYICTSCKINFFLFSNPSNVKKCIDNIYLINECVDYNLTTFECITCNTNFFMGSINNIITCIDNSYVVDNCNDYSITFDCLSCSTNFFLSSISNNVVCIADTYELLYCIDYYDTPSFQCKNCDNLHFMSFISGNISCIDKSFKIIDCIDYNTLPNFECNTCANTYNLVENKCIKELNVENCKTYDPLTSFCVECISGYILNEKIIKILLEYTCILNSNHIENCKNYNTVPDYTCIECNTGYFLYFDEINNKKYCISNQYLTKECEDYNISNYLCSKCIIDFFIFEKLTPDFTLKNICILEINKIPNCLDYEDITFICTECEKDYNLLNTLTNKKLCIHNDSLIYNCIIYNEDLNCEQFNQTCSEKNIEICPICKSGKILVNNECVDICSQKALSCDICEQLCPIYLCIKLIPFCLECDKNKFSQCKRCDDNFVLQNGNCVQEKIIDFFINQEICEDGCSQCFNKLCIQCQFGYYFDENKRICIKNQKIIETIIKKDYCLEKDIFCYKDGKSRLKNCHRCKIKCKCEIFYEKSKAYLNCKNDNIVFTNKNEKMLYLKDIILTIESKNLLKFEFKKSTTKETLIQIPKNLIHTTKNCSFDFIRFFRIENKYYTNNKKTKEATIAVFNYSPEIIPLISSVLSNGILAYLLFICQIQEIFSYLFLINFNGGSFFNYVNSAEFEIYKFPDIINKKFKYEKEFIFERDKYFFIHFFEFQDLCMIICFLVKEIIFFIYVLIKTFYYYKKDGEILHDEYFLLEMYLLKRRIVLFFKSLMLMLCIKNFPKSKKFFLFHNLFRNIFIELLYFFFTLLFILVTFCHLKDQIDFTRQNEKYEDIQYDSEFVILKKKIHRKDDIILNRILIYNYILFFFRSFILQNYFENCLLVKIMIFISFLIFIVYLLVRLILKNKVRLIIFFIFVNEIIFLAYFIFGLDFFKNIVPNAFLNFLYIVCYLGKCIENFVVAFFIYSKNKVKKKKIKPFIKKKAFHFIEGLKIRLDKNSEYFKMIEEKKKKSLLQMDKKKKSFLQKQELKKSFIEMEANKNQLFIQR